MAGQILATADLPIAMTEQQTADAGSLVETVLQGEPTASGQMRRRLADDLANGLQAVSACRQSEAGLEPYPGAAQMGVVGGYVRRVADDELGTAAPQRAEPARAQERHVGYVLLHRITPGHPQSALRNVGSQDLAGRVLAGQGQGDWTAARPQVDDLPACPGGDQPEGGLDQQLGFRPRHEGLGRDCQLHRPEFLAAGEVSHGFAGAPAIHQLPKACCLRRCHGAIRPGVELGALHSEHKPQQHLGIQARRARDVAEAPCGELQVKGYGWPGRGDRQGPEHTDRERACVILTRL
jgi:hypothetical protein